MLTALAYTMVIVFMALIMTKRLSALVALMLVPIVFGLIGGFGKELGPMMLDGSQESGTHRRDADLRDPLLQHHDRRRPV